MTDPTQGLPPAGWYPDPAGAPQQRWWDGRQWTENLQQAVQPAEPIAVSQPIAVPAAIVSPAAFPFQPTEPEARPRRSTSAGKSESADAAAKAAGGLHARALLVIGLATSIAGFALFLYGLLATVDAAMAAQNELYGAIIAGFGALSMLLWLAVGAIRQR